MLGQWLEYTRIGTYVTTDIIHTPSLCMKVQSKVHEKHFFWWILEDILPEVWMCSCVCNYTESAFIKCRSFFSSVNKLYMGQSVTTIINWIILLEEKKEGERKNKRSINVPINVHPADERKGKWHLLYTALWIKNKLCANYLPLIVVLGTRDRYSICLCNVRAGIKISWT